MDGQKMSFYTHIMQSFIGKRVEVSEDSVLDGTRGILRSFVIERNVIVGVIEVRSLIDRLFNREGKLIAAPFESIVDLENSNPLDIYPAGLVGLEEELDTDGEPVQELDLWQNIRKEPSLSEDLKEQMYQEYYQSCPCTSCNHSGSLDTLGENSPCRVCAVADNCDVIDSNCAECKYRDLAEED